MFGLVGLKSKIMLGLILSSFLVGAWYYIKLLKVELDSSKDREIKYQEAIAAKDAETDAIRADIAAMIQSQRKLSAELNAARSNVTNLEKKFNETKTGEKRDLGELAEANPKAIQSSINRGTRDALRCGEVVTGGALTEDEKSGKVTNTICPDIIKPTEVNK